ncbi:hypothetical protein DL767_000217 [Monosporascus sp. MG133]|nr:hypothetical protein DL767_000217 [Monosporascus sp. MG133]
MLMIKTAILVEWRVIWGLNISAKKRVGVSIAFAIGVLSWSNIPRGLLNTDASGRDLSHANLSTSPSSSTYRKIADNGIALKEMPPGRLVGVVGEGQASDGSSAGVLFTKQFTTDEEYSEVTTDIEMRTRQKQHPWEDERTT